MPKKRSSQKRPWERRQQQLPSSDVRVRTADAATQTDTRRDGGTAAGYTMVVPRAMLKSYAHWYVVHESSLQTFDDAARIVTNTAGVGSCVPAIPHVVVAYNTRDEAIPAAVYQRAAARLMAAGLSAPPKHVLHDRLQVTCDALVVDTATTSVGLRVVDPSHVLQLSTIARSSDDEPRDYYYMVLAWLTSSQLAPCSAQKDQLWHTITRGRNTIAMTLVSAVRHPNGLCTYAL